MNTAPQRNDEDGQAQLPPRYEAVLNWCMQNQPQGDASASGKGAAAAPGLQPRKWVAAVVMALGVGCVFLNMVKVKAAPKVQNRASFASSNVLSVQSAGVSNDLTSLLPPSGAASAPSPAPSSSPNPSPAPEAGASPAATTPDPLSLSASARKNPLAPGSYLPTDRPSPAPCKTCEAAKRAAERSGRQALADANRGVGESGHAHHASAADGGGDDDTNAIYIRASLPPPPAVVNVGTRVPGNLTYGIRTDAATVPVEVEIAGDVVAAGRVVIPAGTRVIGEALATRDTDRVQMAFSSLVIGGKTVPLRALAMGPDGQLGLPAKLIKKASGGKNWLGKAVGALGNAATFGLLRSSSGGVAGATAEGLLQRGGQDMQAVEHRWASQRSDKILELTPRAGITLYLEGDLTIE
jgi:type IV secretory pathway VirB10-like protein